MTKYATAVGWEGIESMQAALLVKYARLLQILTRRRFGRNPISILDLGCGTSNIVSSAIRSRKIFVKSYCGVDRDPGALQIARRRLVHSKKRSVQFVRGSVHSFPDAEADLLLCLSNTLLSFGSRKTLEQLVRRMALAWPRRHAIFSVVPWDRLRIAYHKQFTHWLPLVEPQPFSIRVRTTVRRGVVTQRVQFLAKQHGQNQITPVRHQFLALTCADIEKLLHNNGWQLEGWYSPLTGERVVPATTNIPEFYLVCDSRASV